MRAIKVQTDDAASLDEFLEIVDSTSNATVKSRTLKFQRDLGMRIFLARDRLKLTQAGLAKLVHRSSHDVASWETGRRGVSAECLVRLSNVLGVTTDWLLKGDK